MGKTVLPYSWSLDAEVTTYSAFRRALRREDQERFDMLWSYARHHVPAGVAQADPDPFRTALLGMLIELLRRIDEVPCARNGGCSYSGDRGTPF